MAMLGYLPARWLAAAALDRFLVFNQLPQYFGTQFERPNGPWVPGFTDPLRTEALRLFFQIPTRDSLQRRAHGFNRPP